MATPARCPAPNPVQGACGRVTYGEELCPLHLTADPSRVCGAPAGGGTSKPPCRSWTVLGRATCYVHLDRPTSRPPDLVTGRVSESLPPRTQVDTMRALVREADPTTLAYLLNIVAGRLRGLR